VLNQVKNDDESGLFKFAPKKEGGTIEIVRVLEMGSTVPELGSHPSGIYEQLEQQW
jgi:hypothetical protein